MSGTSATRDFIPINVGFGVRSWDADDLRRRVRQALDIAGQTVAAAARQPSLPESEPLRPEIRPLFITKVAAEAAMLLRSVRFLARTDRVIARASDTLARQLIPHARPASLLPMLCHEPALALDHAAAHIHLRALGHTDAAVDGVLREVLQQGDHGGAELLPSQELEHEWLAQIWADDADADADAADATLIARTCIARPLDALGSATADLYAFTHVVLHATDMGRRRADWPRPAETIEADAEAALAAALDADNFDLAAELLWTWPMLGLRWSAAASFAFSVVAASQDHHGFVPGPAYRNAECARLAPDRQLLYRLRTSYHASFVMGFLCAAALRPGRAPPTVVEPQPAPNAAMDCLLPLLHRRSRDPARQPSWCDAMAQLGITQRAALAPFVLTIALRRARAAQDLELLRDGLQVALHCGLVDTAAAGPPVHQAVALLRRAALLGSATPPSGKTVAADQVPQVGVNPTWTCGA